MARPSSRRTRRPSRSKPQAPATTTSSADPSSDRSPGADGDPTSEDWLARFRDGDRAAFQAIVGEFQNRLVQFFFRLCWDRDRAEDLTQELFMKLIRGAANYEAQGKLQTFIFRVATNLWIDKYRAQKPRGRLYSLDQVMLSAGEPMFSATQRHEPSEAPPPEQVVMDEEKQRLRDALICLTEPHRLVFELAVYQELPYAEIGRILEIPVGTVKSRMHNCVRALREELEKQERAGSGGAGSSPFRRGVVG